MKQSTRQKFEYFYGLGVKEPRRLAKVVRDESGVDGFMAFHIFESTGKLPSTREPEVLEALLTGKEIHGITVANVAEDFALTRCVFSVEIKTWFSPWVANEIFSAARKLARERLGFVPGFIAAARDFSES